MRLLLQILAVIEIVDDDVDEFGHVVDLMRFMIRRQERPVCSPTRCAQNPPPNLCMLPLACMARDIPGHAPHTSHTPGCPPRTRQSCAPAPSPPPAPPLCSSKLRSADRRLGLLLTQAPCCMAHSPCCMAHSRFGVDESRFCRQAVHGDIFFDQPLPLRRSYASCFCVTQAEDVRGKT